MGAGAESETFTLFVDLLCLCTVDVVDLFSARFIGVSVTGETSASLVLRFGMIYLIRLNHFFVDMLRSGVCALPQPVPRVRHPKGRASLY